MFKGPVVGQPASQPRWFLPLLGIFSLALLISRHLDLYRLSDKLPFAKILISSPPTYERLHQWENDLPQHNLELPFPEGKTGRYVKFSNQIQMVGWDNTLNEILMNAHLAYESKRSYVFQDYTGKPEHYPWLESQFRQSPPRTPLSALIAGPTSGGLWDAGDDAPRSISEKWFDIVCPASERRIISTQDVKPAVHNASGDEVFAHWVKLLRYAPERCIEIVPAPQEEDKHPQTFDPWLWGSERILSLWPSFSFSPTSRLLTASPIVNSAVSRNTYLFTPRGPRPSRASPHPFERTMAMDIPRGDYEDECTSLATRNSTFYGWNLLPFLPDKFVPLPGGTWGNNTPKNVERYMARCLPGLEDIVRKAREAREDYIRAFSGSGSKERLTLDVMYISTNDQSEWLRFLKRALRKDGWYTIVTGRDLELDAEQRDVGMAVDMEIARRAAVFVGNGWSSFASNIVHRRLIDGKNLISIRFW